MLQVWRSGISQRNEGISMTEKGISEVWVVETGEYESSYIVGICDRYESAIAEIKSHFHEPYVVRWEEMTGELVGHFEAVSGYSTKHTASFNITAYPILRR